MALPGWVPRVFGVASRLAPTATGRLAAFAMLTPRQNPPQPWEVGPLLAGEMAPAPCRLANGLAALRWTAPGAADGPWVFAHHGWEGRPTQFRPLAGALLARGFRVLAVEGPGHGRSPGRKASPWLFAQALLAAQADYGAPAAVIGHSMGGCAVPLALSRGLRAGRAVTLGAPAAMSEIVGSFAGTLRLTPRSRQELQRQLDRHGGQPMQELDPERLVGGLAVPGLVVHCRDDSIIHFTHAERLAAAWPGAQTCWVAGLGHRNVLCAPLVVNQVANFIQGG